MPATLVDFNLVWITNAMGVHELLQQRKIQVLALELSAFHVLLIFWKQILRDTQQGQGSTKKQALKCGTDAARPP